MLLASKDPARCCETPGGLTQLSLRRLHLKLDSKVGGEWRRQLHSDREG